jgi:syntaxin 7
MVSPTDRDIEDEPPRYQDSDPLLRQQQQQRSVTLDMEIQTNEQVIAEREQDIREIEAAIVEVNEIFRDLGTMVAEQGTMISECFFFFHFSSLDVNGMDLLMCANSFFSPDDIERNTEGAAVTIQRANKELGEAQKSQKKSRAKLCWILGIVIVLAGGVVALVLLVK